MESILEQLKALAFEADDATRAKLADSLEELQTFIELPFAVIFRRGYAQIQLVALQVLSDIGVLKALAESEKGLSVTELGEKCNVSTDWLLPLLQVLSAGSLVKEEGEGVFAANALTTAFSSDAYQATLHFLLELIGRNMAMLPEYLKDNNYKAPSDPKNTTFQKAFNTELPSFDYLKTHPKLFGSLHHAMSLARLQGHGGWLSKFPFQTELGDWDTTKPVFVDIGGSYGHQCVELQEHFPQPAGKVILQDLPETIELAPELEGVTKMAYDFWEPQPVRGAKFYYIRRCLHDYPDEKCVQILQNTLQAMGPGSRLLIDEAVLATTGAHWQAATMNLVMMSSLGAKERTAVGWRTLLERAGFRLLEIFTYSPTNGESLLVAAAQ